MKHQRIISLILSVSIVSPALAQRSHSVRGYIRKDGTYVAPHRATNPNSNRSDNWTTRGNVNPYTGKVGTKDPYAPSSTTSTRPRSSSPYGNYN